MSSQSFKVEPDVEEASTNSSRDGVTAPSPQDDPFAVLDALPTSRKLLLLTILCLAIFLDTFNNSSLFAAIPPIAQQLNIPDSQSVWLLSAYQLTFAVLLLVSGRVSDLYNPSKQNNPHNKRFQNLNIFSRMGVCRWGFLHVCVLSSWRF